MYKIFLVEDEEMIRLGLLKTIQWSLMNCEVVGVARHGAEALEFLERKEVDIVLSDVKMPRMDGIALMRELRKRDDRIVGILLTGYADFDYARAAMQNGVASYLLKPVDLHQLAEAISQAQQERDRRLRAAKFSAWFSEGESHGGVFLLETYPLEDPFCAQLFAFLEHAYRRPLSVQDAAEHFHLSSSALSKKIKEHTQMTFLELLHRVRLRHAVALMKQNMRFGEVAEAVGFTEYKHFHHVFQRYFQQSPSQWLGSQTER